MGDHKVVFRSLREIFPQVDLRVLKAVAIEHYKDIDSAVLFILDEVMPSMIDSVGTSSTHCDMREMGSSSSAGHDQHVDDVNGVVHSAAETSSAELISDSQDNVVGGLGVGGFPSHQGMNEQLNLSSHSVPGRKENQHDLTVGFDARYLKIHSESNLGHPDSEVGYGLHVSQSTLVENGTDSIDINIPLVYELGSNKMISTGDCTAQNHSLKFPCDYSESRDVDMKNGDDVLWSLLLANSSNNEVSSGTLSGEKDANVSSVKDLPIPDLVESRGPDGVLLEKKDTMDSGSDYTERHPASSSDSGHSVSVGSLEDSIADAKSCKNDLLPSLELVTKMIEEVNLLEEKAKVAKLESSCSGKSMLTKVEELKEMLNHAKEANDMHAGEVFGEKSILATEARELNCRLQRLSDERGEYLAIVEEIRQALEERSTVAKQEIEAAEKEKIEKEASAQALLNEQEIVMNAIVEESRKLQQEAEENSRLKDFLVERGRIVDALQGEMAVICEDVLLLKQIVDERLPLSKLQRSAMSSLSSSLHSSLDKSGNSSDGAVQKIESTDKHTVTERASPEVEVLDGNDRTDKDNCRPPDTNEDGWEFC